MDLGLSRVETWTQERGWGTELDSRDTNPNCAWETEQGLLSSLLRKCGWASEEDPWMGILFDGPLYDTLTFQCGEPAWR